MKKEPIRPARRILAVLLVGTLLAAFVGVAPVVADANASPMRELPAAVTPGDEFEVIVTFTSPGDGFNAIGLSDLAPAGWTVTVNAAWTTPAANVAHKPADSEAAYIWFGPYDEGVAFTAAYSVQVPPGAAPGTYTFPGGTLEYYVGAPPAVVEEIDGDYEIVVAGPVELSDCQADPDPTKVGYPTTFGVAVSGGFGPYTYAWDFGDGGTSTAEEPTYTYTAAGTWTVSVTVTDELGLEDSCSFELVVNPPLALSDCMADPNPTKVDYATDFSVTVSGGIGEYTYEWNFGDDSTSEAATPTHTFTTPGTYTVTVTVWDELENMQTCSFELVVNPPLSLSDCQADPDPTWIGYSTEFSVAVTGGVAPYTYDWDFGDGGSSTDESPAHAYAASGTYTVTVTVTDSLGNTDDCSFDLDVDESAAVIEGHVRAVNCDELSGVTVSLYSNDTLVATAVSAGDGSYMIAVPALGDYRVVASLAGFRNHEKNAAVTDSATYTIDFVADHGLIPNAPDTSYVLKCINLWQYGAPPCELTMTRVLAVINAWQFPIHVM